MRIDELCGEEAMKFGNFCQTEIEVDKVTSRIDWVDKKLSFHKMSSDTTKTLRMPVFLIPLKYPLRP
ncbi:hypothetical protein RRG08_056328 [Elysia crispata]|uniref:Uncharacterized protein n=1 Tax=Elysia crispata TaxID=231223 RepID=A0AAE1D339_9GAST|nr:hypothetical protein RRG08_056328 [Elysia crispata]